MRGHPCGATHAGPPRARPLHAALTRYLVLSGDGRAVSVGALQGAGSARQALADLRRARRRRRMSEVDVMEALYHAYVAAIVGGLALWWIALRVGGHEVARASVHSALVHGPEMVGLAIAAALAIAAGLAGCRTASLPEHGSAAERLYAQRCGSCHKPYSPSSMTVAMWATQVDAMEPKIAQAGLPPLSEDERRAILNYLERNAGAQ